MFVPISTPSITHNHYRYPRLTLPAHNSRTNVYPFSDNNRATNRYRFPDYNLITNKPMVVCSPGRHLCKRWGLILIEVSQHACYTRPRYIDGLEYRICYRNAKIALWALSRQESISMWTVDMCISLAMRLRFKICDQNDKTSFLLHFCEIIKIDSRHIVSKLVLLLSDY